MSISHSGGVNSVGAFTQPAVTPTSDCVRYISADCSTGFDPNADNARVKEFLNVMDKAGLPYDCGALDNMATAICSLICQRINESRDQGQVSGTYSEGNTVTVTYSTAFANTPVPVVTPFFNGDLGTGGDAWWQIDPSTISATGFTAALQTASGGATSNGFTWQAQTPCTTT